MALSEVTIPLFLVLRVFALGIFTLYCIVILFSWYGWIRIKDDAAGTSAATNLISIIIAARNEKKHLPLLLSDLSFQSYPLQSFEIIIVDDHSDERISSSSIKEDFKNLNLQIIDLPKHKHGKKEAIFEGVKRSKSELLIFTDADCRVSQDWISCFARRFQNEKSGMLIGMVDYPCQGGAFHIFARFDLLSLVVAGAGLANFGKPVMCNGANLAIKKDLYTCLTGQLKVNIPSGDDIFLLHAVKKLKSGKISIVKSSETIVTTQSPENLLKFMAQRLRWTSKGRYYTDIDTILLALLVILVNLIMMAIFVNSLIYHRWLPFVLLFLIKTLTDGFILSSGLKFFGGLRNIVWLPFFELIYPLYVIFLSIGNFFIKFSWKGRKNSGEASVLM